MSMTKTAAETRDQALRARARRVIPGGMYGHQNAAAHTDDDIAAALERTDEAFAAVRARFGPDA